MPESLWGELLKQDGWEVVILFLAVITLLANLKNLMAFFDGLLQRFFPSYEARAKEREHEREMERRQVELVEKERVDTVILFKDTMLEYRRRLDDLEIEFRRERKEHEAMMYELYRGKERLEAQVVEALRDISEVQRALIDRFDKFIEWAKEISEVLASLVERVERLERSQSGRRRADDDQAVDDGGGCPPVGAGPESGPRSQVGTDSPRNRGKNRRSM